MMEGTSLYVIARPWPQSGCPIAGSYQPRSCAGRRTPGARLGLTGTWQESAVAPLWPLFPVGGDAPCLALGPGCSDVLGAPGGDGDRAESRLAAIRAHVSVPRDREVLFCGWAGFHSACDAKCIAPGAAVRSGIRCSRRIPCRCCGDTESSAEEHKDMQSCSLHPYQPWRWYPGSSAAHVPT